MSAAAAIVGQFRRPHGVLGRVAGFVMSRRASNRRRNAWTVGLLDLKPADRVLELGCGPGLALAAALARGSSRVLGIDHSPLMLGQSARRNRAALEAGRLALLCGDLASLELVAGPFDAAFAVNVLQFLRVDERRALFVRLRAILAPGARAAFTFQPRLPGASAGQAEAFADALSAELAGAGLDRLRREWLALAPVPAVCVLAGVPA